MDNLFLSWLAGFIDGEGSIMLSEAKRHNKSYFVLRISITQTNLEILEYIKEITKLGEVHKAYRQKSHHSPAWVWNVNHKETKILLNQILPYLKLKQPQAKLALEFYKFWEDFRPPKKRRGKPSPDFDYSPARKYKKRMHRLNWRPSSDYSPEEP